MTKKQTKLTDQLRMAIDAANRSRYSICQDSGVDQATMSRLMAGRSVSSDTIDQLTEALGLELVQRQGKKGR